MRRRIILYKRPYFLFNNISAIYAKQSNLLDSLFHGQVLFHAYDDLFSSIETTLHLVLSKLYKTVDVYTGH